MQYAELGSTGLRLSRMSFGTAFRSGFDEQKCLRAIESALDLGCNSLDTANIYQSGRSEELVGTALRGRRDHVVVTTKVGEQAPEEKQLSRATIMREVEGSLRRLATDYIDLYLCHKPDPSTPFAETIRAMDDLVVQGKVRYVGVSNYQAWQVCEGLCLGDRDGLTPLVCDQVPYSLLDRRIEDELVPFCSLRKVGITAYCTTFVGLLSGDYRLGAPPDPGRSWDLTGPYRYDLCLTPATDLVIETCRRIGGIHGRTAANVAMAWCLHRPEVTSVIAGADSEERVRSDFAAVDLVLTQEEIDELDSVSRGMRMAPSQGSV